MRSRLMPPTLVIFAIFMVICCNVVSVQASDGSDAMQKLCLTLSRATQCKASFKVPTFKVRNGKVTWFKFNPCKTKFKFLGGKQCLPGTDAVTVVVPVGIDVGSKSVDGCDLARAAIPGLDQLSQKSGALCKCLPEASRERTSEAAPRVPLIIPRHTLTFRCCLS